MSKIGHLKSIAAKKPGVARTAIACMLLTFVFGCGDADTPPVYSGPGTGGSTGSGGASGPGGTAGMGGISGSGGMTGTGASSGTGGMVGTGGTGGSVGPCATSALCHTCPDRFVCDTDDTCTSSPLNGGHGLSGYVCIPSGCKTHGGAAIKQCQPARGGSCSSESECPNTSDYECIPVGGLASTKRCVRVTSGCEPIYEAYDCAPGFSCEGNPGQETCVDRRVPCDSSFDCPKSHVCTTTPASKFCIRVYRTCHVDEDCLGFAAAGSHCADVDGDRLTMECVGNLDGNACVNSDCNTTSAPVCEVVGDETIAACGDYGLCLSDSDCDVAEGFSCVGLWQDGRKECVQTPLPSDCDQVTDCPPPQVCAAPRNGGRPSCQAGKEAM